MTSERQPAHAGWDLWPVFQAMVELAVLHELVLDVHGRPIDYRILECNPAFTAATGIPREVAVGRLASEVYRGPPPYLDVYARVATSGRAERFDTYFRPLDRHFSISVVSPRKGHFATIATDVTEHVRAESALRRYQILAEHTLDIILFTRRQDGRLLDANPAALAAYGYSREELLSRSIVDLRAPDHAAAVPAQLAEADERGIRFETVHRRKDGTCFPVEVSSSGTDLGGTRVLVSVVRDVTARRRAEERVAAERERLAVTLASIGDAVISTDVHARVDLMNEVAERLTGWTAAEAAGRPIQEVFRIVNEETRLPVEDPVDRVLREGVVVGLANHTALIARDGSERPIADSGAPIRGPDRKIHGAVLVFRDQTEERRSEEALRESEERYRTLVSVSPYPMVVHVEGRIVFANPAALAAFAAGSEEELLGGAPLALLHPEDRARVGPLIAAARAVSPVMEARIVRLDGVVRDVELTSASLGRGATANVMIFRDVTDALRAARERERLQEQLAASRRLETVGRLAGGVAHDFNNLLTVILSCTESLKAKSASGGPVDRADLGDIEAAGLRARDLTRRLLAFARKQVAAPVVLDLNEATEGARALIARLVGEHIRVEVELAPGPLPVEVDPAQLEQVILNLAVNARDALPTGGRLRMRTGASCPGAKGEQGAAARFSRVVVQDDGVGMTDEVMSHLFEPFFTTKPPGKGTGLGLATVHGIVHQAGGHLHVASQPGLGTTVEVCLPVAVRAVEPTRDGAGPGVARGSECVLVVEDDETVRRIAVRTLADAGYRVLTAESGGRALEVLPGAAGVDLLVTDVVMPEVNGRVVADAYRARFPAGRVLFVSGYTQDVIDQQGVTAAGVEFLAKPFTPAMLLQKVRRVLDEAG